MLDSLCFPDPVVPPIQVLRLDKNDPLISGNKFYKLKPWIKKAQQQQAGLMSCGGAWSNHLHALAAAGQRLDIPTAGLVRGLEDNNLTPTLEDCQQMGMQLIGVTRQQYRDRHEPGFAGRFEAGAGGKTLWVPEGGTCENSVRACEEIGHLINTAHLNYDFDSVWLAVGSGGTLAGIARCLHSSISLYAVPVMAHWSDVKARVNGYLNSAQAARITWVSDGYFGGFGRINQQHLAFMRQIHTQLDMPFDPVYTGKLLRRMVVACQQGDAVGTKPLLVHTGGLQGRRSLDQC